jgi:hypothetical protein
MSDAISTPMSTSIAVQFRSSAVGVRVNFQGSLAMNKCLSTIEMGSSLLIVSQVWAA